MQRLTMPTLAFFLLIPLIWSEVTLAAAGDLDDSFGTGGIVELIDNFSEGAPKAGIGVQSGGEIIAGARYGSGSSTGVVIVRFNSDGTVDSTFGNAGFARVAGYHGGGLIAIEPDDKILSAGGQSSNAIQLLRFSSNGVLEQYGESAVSSSDGLVWVSDIAVQPNGQILLAGETQGDFLLARFNKDLTLDRTFGDGGYVITPIGEAYDAAWSLAIDPAGRVVLAGESYIEGAASDSAIALARYMPDGHLDSTFGVGGIVTTVLGTYVDRAEAVAIQADGKIIVSGHSRCAQSQCREDFTTLRYLSDGSLDTAFGENGAVITEITGSFDYASHIALQANNKILVAGDAGSGFALARYNGDGSLDPDFGDAGVSLVDGLDVCCFLSATLDGSGNIVLAEVASGATSQSKRLVMARFDASADVTPVACEGDFTLRNQAELDAFGARNCNSIAGDLWVGTYQNPPSDINDLRPLSSLNSVGGEFRIEYVDGLTDLEGLSGLTSAGVLFVYENDFLTDVSSLSNLTEVESVIFSDNDALTNVNGLVSLTDAFKIEIGNHKSLTNVDGLSNLRTVEILWIYNNYQLVSLLGLAKLQSATSISIGGNSSLRSLSGLSAPSVRTRLSITGNDSLSHVDGLVGFTEIQGNLEIRYNQSLRNLDGLINLTSVGGSLSVYANEQLGKCEALADLLGWPSGPPQDSVGSTITIRDNALGCSSVSEIIDSVGTASYVVSPSVGSAGGTVSPSVNQIVEEGGTISFTFGADANYQLDTIRGTCGGARSGMSFTTDPITQDCTVIGYFMPTTPETYEVTILSGANGSVSPSGTQQVSSGDQVSITVMPDQGFEVKSVGGTCTVTQTSYLTYMTEAIEADCSVEFSFHRSAFTVTPSSGSGGVITPSSAQQVPRGDRTTFTLLPDTGYEVRDVTGTCGGSLAGRVFTTNAIQADCSVLASFEMISGNTPPSKPALETTAVSSSTATLQIIPSSQGSDPITSYTTECSVDDSIFRESASPRMVPLGFFSGAQQVSPVSAQIGEEFRANPDLFSLSRGMVVRFDHDGGFSDFRIDRITATPSGNLFVASEVTPSHWLQLLVRPDGNFFGNIVLTGESYQSYVQSGQTVFYSSEKGQLAPNPFAGDALHDNGAYTFPSGGISEAVSDDPAVVTVGILVDNALAGLSPEDLLVWIDWLMSSANAIYQDSGVDIAFVVADIIQYEPGSSLTISQKLSQISCGSPYCQPGSGLNSAVTNWRLQVGADMVVQLIGTGTGGTCGMGSIAPNLSVVSDPNNLALYTHSVSALQNGFGSLCPSNVVAHEMGHNFSLNHNREQNEPAPNVYSYGVGYKLPNGYGSMMSYPDFGFDGYLPYLSNPEIVLGGYPLGTPTNQPNPAFAALSTQNLRSYYERIINNGDINLVPPAPELESYTSTTSSVTLTFQPKRDIGQKEPNLFTASCSGVTASSSSSPITVSGLASGSPYSCRVNASNQFGTGPYSNSLTVTTKSPASYTVTPSSGAGGSISPSSPQTVEAGDVTSFTVTPSNGFGIASVTGCGGRLVGSIFTTAPVTANCSVRASFTEQVNSYVVTPVAGAGGSLTPNQPQTVEGGQSVSFTVSADQGYRIKQVSGCNGTLSGSTYNTGPVTSSCDVRATFEAYWVVSGPSTTVSLTGLPESRKIQCQTFATNVAGDSPLSDIEYFVTGEPSKPSGVRINGWDAGDEEISLNVSVSSNGGVKVSSYEATCTDGTSSYTVASNSSSITVTGLRNGASYTCTAAAINSVGRSEDSPETTPIVPEYSPTGLPIWLLYEASK